jgi:hypothetical protein
MLHGFLKNEHIESETAEVINEQCKFYMNYIQCIFF